MAVQVGPVVLTRMFQSASSESTFRWRFVGARDAAELSAYRDRTAARLTAAATLASSVRQHDDTPHQSAYVGIHQGMAS